MAQNLLTSFMDVPLRRIRVFRKQNLLETLVSNGHLHITQIFMFITSQIFMFHYTAVRNSEI